MSSSGGRDKTTFVLSVLVVIISNISYLGICDTCHASSAPPSPEISQIEHIVLLTLDKEPVADGFIVVEKGGSLFLPLCGLSEAVSIGIRCMDRRAYGFIIEESRPFVIDLDDGYVISGRTAFPVGTTAFQLNGDVYVGMKQLSSWLPLEFTFEKNTSNVEMHATEVLPVQSLRTRQKMSFHPPSPEPAKLCDVTPPRAAASAPTIDFSSQLMLSGEEWATMQGASQNSLDLSGDLLYLSAEAHLSAENDVLRRLDLSLSKRSVVGFDIGPFPLTQIKLGSSQVPYIDGIGASSTPMYGIYASNRPVTGSSNFLTHNINGSLPQGWDAELFHNGMPIAYQPPTSDNMYHFQNLQVYYGINTFKVVQHGPFGELRESEDTFITDAITPKGQFLYTLSTVWQTGIINTESEGWHQQNNMTFTSDFGLTRDITGAASAVRHTDNYGVEREYGALGLRSAIKNTLISMDVIAEFYPGTHDTGGLFTVKASSRDVLGLMLEATQRAFWNYDSQQFPKTADPPVTVTTLKGNSSFTVSEVRIPFATQLEVDSYRSGDVDETSAWRLSGGWNGWNGAVEADIANIRHNFTAAGLLQISTWLRDVSIRGQAGFSVAPELYASTINISADKDLGRGFLLNSSVSHDPTTGITELKAGLSKRFGLIGYSFAATGNTNGAFSLTAGLQTSFAADRPDNQVMVSAEPLSSYGMIAVSATAQDDANPVGRSLPGVAFLVNGTRTATIKGSKGFPVITNLQPDVPVDVTIDMTSVEDPFMVPVESGCRITPRAGVVSECKFHMTSGGEIDGVVMVRSASGEIPIKDVKVYLVSVGANGENLQVSTQSQESGYYLFKTVRPGDYRVEIPEAELARLKAAAVAPIAVTMPVGGDMVSGKDFYLSPVTAGGAPAVH